MKFVIETGSGSHTTSSASCQAKFVGGEYDGKNLYEVKKYVVKTDWLDSKHNERWVLTEYNLPEGTQIAVIGKGRTGNRGSTKHEFHRIYKLDSTADVVDESVDVGLNSCTLKGRMVLVRDLIAERTSVNTEEGF